MTFSVIIPVYNVEKYLHQCLNSVLLQSHGDIEIILVDDGSTDGSADLCDGYAEKDSRIKVIHKKNGGLSSARNVGMDNATGDYIIFLDSDDYWANRNMLAQINEAAEEYPDTFITWGFQRCGESETVEDTDTKYPYKRYLLEKDYEFLFSSNAMFASGCNGAIPRQWLENGSLRFAMGDISEDVEWYAELLLHIKNVVVFDAKFYVYRMRNESLSNSADRRITDMMRKHVLYLIDKCSDLSSPVLNAYTAEQIANYVIVLSRTEGFSEYLEQEKDLISAMSYAVRRRSRLIYRSAKAIGLRGTIRLLQAADFLV